MALSMAGKEASLLKRIRGLLPGSADSYLVGGYIRDTLLGRKTRDIDVAVGVSAPGFAREVAAALDGHYVLLDEAEGIARVVLLEGDAVRETQWHLDFSTIRGTIESDLSRRDFTIDAMAIDLSDIGKRSPPRLIDLFGGKKDLEAKLIRAVNPSIFEDDPARLIRGVRLAGQYGFSIVAGTAAMMGRQGQLISQVAGERVREELCHIL